MRVPCLLAATLACLSALAVAEDVYKCTNAQGDVAYQDRPCPSNAQESQLHLPDAPPPLVSDRLPPNADDGTMDPAFRQRLTAKCASDPSGNVVTQVLDVRTPNAFDNKYYFDLIAKQGLFKSDQGLINHPDTKRAATRFALNQAAFFDQFARSMVKMSQMDILTGSAGEIRRNCSVRNTALGDVSSSAQLETTAGDEGLAADA